MCVYIWEIEDAVLQCYKLQVAIFLSEKINRLQQVR